ncbi:MAG: LysR family transcriptional regulator [Clostridiales bacterium]|nr:LysR family transcriptional regulator [Clostridiales bacterium]
MNMKEIEVLVTIVRSKSFYEAGYMLNYSPSAISKYVKSAENELGVLLFNRGNRASPISLTKEGAALMPSITDIYEAYSRLKEDADALRSGNDKILRVGTGHQLSSMGMDEILANFFITHPEIRVEQSRMNYESLIHALYSGKLDGVSLLVQDGSLGSKALDNLLKDPKIESHLLVREHDMYLGISDRHPLAECDSAPLNAFKDFSIAFHSDRTIRTKAGTMEPFLRLSEKRGFKLNPIFIDPRDVSAFILAAQKKVAVPSLRCLVRYPGVKFIRIQDWETFTTAYFLSLKANHNPALLQLIKTIRAYCEHE